MLFPIINALVTITMFGGLLLLAFIKLANPLGINRRGNFFFGLLLLLWASFWMEEIGRMAGLTAPSALCIHVVQWLQIFAPVCLFLSIRFYASPGDRFAWNDARHLIMPFVFLLVLWLKIERPERQSILLPVHIALMFFQVFFYVIVSYLKVKRHLKNLVRFESYTINAGYQLNFSQFVNQYRVEKAKELLLNNHQNYTVLAIAYESGFNSKTAFNTTFKKICGLTPTEFTKAHAS